ncbi:hypothetical protein [Psychrobacter sp. 1Y4]
MDSLSQIVLGASVQGTILGKYQGRKAYLYGARYLIWMCLSATPIPSVT